jgi:CheY-like chemotaxis protein
MSRLNILIADDDEMVRSILRLMLGARGYGVTEAADGVAALKQYREAPEKYNLVLLDQHMPNLGGPEALQQMRTVCPGLKAILLSGGLQECAAEDLETGRTRQLQKPFEYKELITLVGEMVGPAPLPMANPLMPFAPCAAEAAYQPTLQRPSP